MAVLHGSVRAPQIQHRIIEQGNGRENKTMDWSLGRTSARQDQTMGSPQGRNFESVYFTSNNVPPLYPNNHLGGSSDTVYFLNPMTPMDISPLVPRTPQYSGVSQGTSNEIAPIPLSRPSSTGEAIKMIALWDVPDTRKSTKGGMEEDSK